MSNAKYIAQLGAALKQARGPLPLDRPPIGMVYLSPGDRSPAQPRPDLSYLACRYCWPCWEPHTQALHANEVRRAKMNDAQHYFDLNPTDEDLNAVPAE